MKNPNITKEEQDYITLEKFNLRLGAKETVKVGTEDL